VTAKALDGGHAEAALTYHPPSKLSSTSDRCRSACARIAAEKKEMECCGAECENTVTIRQAKLQSAMLLEGRQQGWDHHLEPLAAHPIRRFPQRRQRILDRRAISAPALLRCLDPIKPNRIVLPECAHRMLAMPARRRALRVEDPPLLLPSGRPVTLPNLRAARLLRATSAEGPQRTARSTSHAQMQRSSPSS
jgi:hypothetical protein